MFTCFKVYFECIKSYIETEKIAFEEMLIKQLQNLPKAKTLNVDLYGFINAYFIENMNLILKVFKKVRNT